MRRTLIVIFLFQFAAHHLGAQTTSAPARPETLAQPSSGDPAVDAILDKLEFRGQAIKSLRADLIYKFVTVDVVEDETVKEGDLLFAQGKPNSRFRVHFKRLSSGGVVKDTGEYFAFDGEWLTERNDKSRTVIKRQVARPGERRDPFRLGQGPFPLPLGQKRRDILDNFRVTLEKPTAADPKNADHLHCVPLKDTDLANKYSQVEIYVDRTTELPTRIVAELAKDGNRIEVDLRNPDTSEAPAASRFEVEVPKDFEVTVEAAEPTVKIEAPPKVTP